MMKTLPTGFLIPSLALVLAGCGNDGAPAPSTAAPAEPAAAAASPVVVPMATYATAVADLARGGNCALDAINGAAVADTPIASGQDLVFSGWIADGSGQVPADARLVLSSPGGSYAAPVTAGVHRPDVAKALGQPGLANSGYNLTTHLMAAPGSYELFVVHGEEPGRACRLNRRLVVE